MKATDVFYIVMHCTAGYGNVASIKRFWKETLGWKSPGYHVVIDLDGTKHYLQDFDKPTNGVKSYNGQCLHISYIGGVDPDNYSKAKDTRTKAQKIAMLEVAIEMIMYLKKNGKDVARELMILGHRDFSVDQNKDGIIASWERIKECPSFDAIPEFEWIGATNKVQLLPYNRK